MAQGFVFWRGPSPIDGAMLVAIATLDCNNSKTGDMVQTWVLREDMSPLDAVGSGYDIANCGSCYHRGVPGVRKRSCYVQVGQAPENIWGTYQRGQYVDLSEDLRTLQGLVRGRKVRLGAYGDPAMLPAHVWYSLLFQTDGHTGYTHQWREPFAEAYRNLVMASVESPEEQAEAVADGWRTFRVRRAGDPLGDNEFVCPASEEAGNRKTCATCLACNGADRPGKASAVIIAHGSVKIHFIAAPLTRKEARVAQIQA